jgi:transposase InsO family protein
MSFGKGSAIKLICLQKDGVMTVDKDLAMKVATFRFGIIAEFVTGVRLKYGEKERLLAEKAVRSYEIPGSGQTRVSRSVMLSWIAAYRKGGHRIEALCPKEREDKGRFRTLATPVRMEIKRLKLENPYYTVPVILKKLRLAKVIGADEAINKATVYRFIRKECQNLRPEDGEDRRRFEAEHSNDIWQCDVLHGPMVQVDGSSTLKKAYLLAIIDDHSRFIVHAAFYPSETFETLKVALHEAVARRGIPQKFYVDNGSCYRSDDLERILVCLGIVLSHSCPYKPQGRGKIERWFKNVRDSFLPLLPMETISLIEINERLADFVDEYNNRVHSSIDSTPYQRYCRDLSCIRPAPERLMDYFRIHEYRRVKKDRTVQLHGRVFEVSAKLIDKTVDLLFHASEPCDIEVKYQGASYGKAVPVNLIVNARSGRDWGLGTRHSEIPEKPENRSFTPQPIRGGTLFESATQQEHTNACDVTL